MLSGRPSPGVASTVIQPVPVTPANTFTVASFNIERFYNPAQTPTDDIYYVPAGVTGFNGNSSTGTVSTGQTFTSAAVDITQAAYTRRLKKVSLAIRTVLNTPDIVTLEEVENQSVANDIATQLSLSHGTVRNYLSEAIGKLGAANRIEAYRLARQKGWL